MISSALRRKVLEMQEYIHVPLPRHPRPREWGEQSRVVTSVCALLPSIGWC